MYRVAVILNESELLRSGYANVTRRLHGTARFSSYHLESFSIGNIEDLFKAGPGGIATFDSIVITTNATSDRGVLNALRLNRQSIETFLDSGKGLLILSQKKLSVRDGPPESGLTGFLPDFFDYRTIERPATEPDSGQGDIQEFDSEARHVVMLYPEAVSAQSINERCLNNEFRRHFYRSHMLMKSSGAYQPILGDHSHEGDPRVLLMASQPPQSRGRIIGTTIVLDWAYHAEMLVNSIVFVTEGAPRTAFIDNPSKTDPDFDFLLTNAALSKAPHIVYQDLASISSDLAHIHDTYIFSPDWPSNEVVKLLPKSEVGSRKKRYQRFYFFHREYETLSLTHHSTFSTLDLLFDRGVLWLDAQFEGGFWGGSFWVTHDVLLMMLSAGVDVSPYLPGVLADLKSHFREGSYDVVMGASCGMLILLTDLRRGYSNVCDAHGFTQTVVAQAAEWIIHHSKTQSDNDKLSAFLALHHLLSGGGNDSPRFPIEIREEAFRVLGRTTTTDQWTEIELCQLIEVLLICDPAAKEKLAQLIYDLKERQATDGGWTDVGRTAHVLVLVVSHWEVLNSADEGGAIAEKLNSMVYNGMLFLRSRFQWSSGCWNSDTLASAKALHAICLCSRKFNYSTQDFLKTLDSESENIEAANLLRQQASLIGTLRDSINGLSGAHGRLGQMEAKVTRMQWYQRTWGIIWGVAAFTSTSAIIALLSYLWMEQRPVFSQTLKALAIWQLVAGALLGVAAQSIINMIGASRTKERQSESTQTRDPKLAPQNKTL